MRRPLPTRRRFSLLPTLALLGVAGTAASLPFAPRAAAIGGGVAPASQPTSPRETTGATPSLSLFQTSAASYTGGASASGGGGGGGGGSNASTTSEVTSSGSSSGNAGGGEEREPARRRRPATTAATPEVVEEPRAGSAGRRRMAARRERAERDNRTTTYAASGKGVVDSSKESKATVVPPPKDRIRFTLAGGWQSRYIYHGQDIVSFNSKRTFFRGEFFVDGNGNFLRDANGNLIPSFRSSQPQSSSIWFTNFSAEYKGFQFKLDYVQAVDSTVPFLQGVPGTSDVPAVIVDRNGNLSFPTKRRIYRELDPGFSYTVGLGKLFDATVGYTFFLFPNDDFKGTHYEGEALVKLTYKQLKFIRPSFLYFHYNSPYSELQAGDLNGSFVQFRVDGDLPVIEQPRFSVSLQPYVLGNYNINFLRYNGSDQAGNPTTEVGGWSSFETGLKVPITLAKRFTVTPFGNYGVNIADDANAPINNFTKRGFGEKTRFWGGVNVSCSF